MRQKKKEEEEEEPRSLARSLGRPQMRDLQCDQPRKENERLLWLSSRCSHLTVAQSESEEKALFKTA